LPFSLISSLPDLSLRKILEEGKRKKERGKDKTNSAFNHLPHIIDALSPGGKKEKKKKKALRRKGEEGGGKSWDEVV